MDEWRQFLYYPLGLLPSIFFTLRMLLQWFQSERYGRSLNTPLFWQLSISGNVLSCLHYMLQLQSPFALLQVGNAVIAWRNLNLMHNGNPKTTQQVGILLCATLLIAAGLYAALSYFSVGEIDWVRSPLKPFDKTRTYHAFGWHLFGFIGSALFAGRFWVQWWNSERNRRSELDSTFWRLSIAGSLISLIYFIHIGDTVSTLNNSFGLLPYIRNLTLMKQAQTTGKP